MSITIYGYYQSTLSGEGSIDTRSGFLLVTGTVLVLVVFGGCLAPALPPDAAGFLPFISSITTGDLHWRFRRPGECWTARELLPSGAQLALPFRMLDWGLFVAAAKVSDRGCLRRSDHAACRLSAPVVASLDQSVQLRNKLLRRFTFHLISPVESCALKYDVSSQSKKPSSLDKTVL